MNTWKWIAGLIVAAGAALVPSGLNIINPTGPPTVKLPAQISVAVNEPARIVAATNCGTVVWHYDAALQKPAHLADLTVPANVLIVAAAKAGTYTVTATVARGSTPSEPSTCTVYVGVPAPDPGPDPAPGPKPSPPAPPKPAPPQPKPDPPAPPAPTDPLTFSLQAAYSADPMLPSIKRGQLVLLTGLAQEMVTHAQDLKILTSADLMADYSKAAGGMILRNSLLEMRKVIAGEVKRVLGSDPAAKLDPTLRPLAVDCFTRIAAALERVR